MYCGTTRLARWNESVIDANVESDSKAAGGKLGFPPNSG